MGMLRDTARYRAEGARLGHAPGVDHLDPVPVPIPANHGERRCGAAAGDAVEDREVVSVRLRLEQRPHPLPDGRHPGRQGDRLRHDEIEQLLGGHEAVRHHLLGPEHGRGERKPPAHHVEHRCDCERAVGAGEVQDVRHRHAHGVEVGRAVGVHHPLRVAGGAARVAQAERGVLIELRPCEVRAESVEEGFVVDRVRQGGLPRLRSRLAAYHVALDRGEIAGESFEEGREVRVEEHDTVAGVVDDVPEILRPQSDIQGVQDRSHRWDRVVELEVAPAVPHEGRDPVTDLDPEVLEAVREGRRARSRVCVGLAVRTARGQGHHLGLRRDPGAAVQQP